MNEEKAISRPPIGFIVEGKDEYCCYPSIVSQLVKQKYLNIPIAVANGYGGIINHLEEHLSDIISSHKPISIIITIDLIDVLNAGIATGCAELREMIVANITKWVDINKTNRKLQPFPEKISVVIQIQKFESWLIADKESLSNAGFINIPAGDEPWTNVDVQVINPCYWFSSVCCENLKIKKPEVCRSLMRVINLEKVKVISPSFNKFSREVIETYDYWLKLLASP